MKCHHSCAIVELCDKVHRTPRRAQFTHISWARLRTLSAYARSRWLAPCPRRPTSRSHWPLPSAPTGTWTRPSLKSQSRPPPRPPSAPQSSCLGQSTTSFRHRPNHTMWASCTPSLMEHRTCKTPKRREAYPSRRCACPLSRTPRKTVARCFNQLGRVATTSPRPGAEPLLYPTPPRR